MNLVVDLHSHSPYAGASGKVDFERLRFVMGVKGIDIYGSGDILLEKWEKELDSEFEFDRTRQLWNIGGKEGGQYLFPQTEVIVTLPYPYDERKRKLFHLVILFEKRESIKQARKMFLSKGSKLGIGRPFVKFDSKGEMQQFFSEFKKNIPSLLVPAHVVTPDGILGGKNPVDSVREIWGDEEVLLDALESGLSADPEMLSSVSAALSVPVISSSDAHSAAFNRLGREFTEIEADKADTSAVFDSIKSGKIVKTAEFPPFEGRYYLTGHRGDREGHKGEDVFFKDTPPSVCPVCGKPLIHGVRERTASIYQGAKGKIQPFVYQIPLIEVVAESLKCGAGTKRAVDNYMKIISQVGRESHIWLENDTPPFHDVPAEITEGIDKIKKNRFDIVYGFDGKYGRIVI